MPESKRRKPKARPQTQETSAGAAAKSKDPSPTWYVTIMAGLMVIGVILVLLRFILQWDQWVLAVGLAAIAAGFLMTTNYR